MFGGGKGMGGGGGSMLRAVGRTVTRAGVTNLQEPLPSSSSSTVTSSTANSRPTHKPSSSTNNNNTYPALSSATASPFSACNIPVCTTPSSRPSHSGSCCDEYEYEWVSVDGPEDHKSYVLAADDFALGSVPTVDEVHGAVSALTQAFNAPYSQLIRDKFAYNGNTDLSDPISSPMSLLHGVCVGSELDWMEPSPYLDNPRMLNPYGSQRVYDAFHLLQNEPSVQRMVISLSSDKAVWDAVLNNSVVQELRETYYADENIAPPTSESSDENGDESNPATNFVRWILDNTRAKFMEVMEKITKLVNELFKPPTDEKTREGALDPFEERLRTSFMLSIVVLMIVIVTRATRA